MPHMPLTDAAAARRSATPASRLPGLDGLRALAVAAVVVFHVDSSLLPGGFLGVDLFFVISGFLITTLLLEEGLDRGRVDLRGFYVRRGRRLLPSVLAVVAAVGLAALVWPAQRGVLGGGALASLGFSANWWLIFDHQPYFASSGQPPMLQHMWSLAIEEQFYLVWAPLLVVLIGGVGGRLGLRARPLVVAGVAGAAALVSTSLMAGLAIVHDLPYGGSTARVYFGSDTHAAGLFVGATAAALVIAGRERGIRAGRVGSFALDAAGLAGLVLVVHAVVATDQYRPWLYRGGFLGFDLAAVAVVGAAARHASLLGRCLDVAPARWVGRRSYSIYLWHWPLVVATLPRPGEQGPRWLLDLGRGALVVVVAALAFRFIEARWRRPRDPAVHPVGSLSRPGVVVPAAALAVTALLAGLALAAPSTSPSTAAVTARSSPQDPAAGGPVRPHRATVGRLREPGAPALSAYGDSVLLGARDELRRHTGRLHLDAVEGRRAEDVLADIRADADRHRLLPDVLIHVGDNGAIDPARLRATLDRVGPTHRVVLLTVLVSRDWQRPNNRVIAAATRGRPWVTVLDWRAVADRHADWLYGDGIHLRPAGASAYCRLVLGALTGR